MTGPLKYNSDILNFSSQLEFPEEDVFYALGLIDIIFRMTGPLIYHSDILNFSSQLKFPEEDFFLSTWTTKYNFLNDGISKI